MPNGDIIYSIHTAYLWILTLPRESRKAHIFPHLKKALLSIGTLCDHGCIAVFDDKGVTISDKHTGAIHITGKRGPEPNLYNISLLQQALHNKNLMTEIRSPEKPFAGSVYECSSKKALVDYHHASCWSPTKSG